MRLVLLGKRVLFSTGSFIHDVDDDETVNREKANVSFFPPSTATKASKTQRGRGGGIFKAKEIRLISLIQFNLLLLLLSSCS